MHPAVDSYQVMAEKLEEELVRPVSSFSNSGSGSGPIRPMPDMTEYSQYWVESCSPASQVTTVSGVCPRFGSGHADCGIRGYRGSYGSRPGGGR
jgi:hypothetical protein